MSIRSQLANSARCAVVILSLSITFTGTAYANQCGDISQSLTAMGDSYYDIDSPAVHPRQGKSEQQILLEQSIVFSQLRDARFKDGTGERTRCFGTEKNRRTEASIVELKDILQQNNSHRRDSELALHAFEHDKENKRIRRESIYLSSGDNIDVLTTADGNALKLNTRRRQSTTVGSFLRETAISAISTDRGIDIRQSTYVNGQLAEWFSWSLNTK